MTGKTGAGLKAVLKHLGKQRFITAEGGQAVADVAGGRMPISRFSSPEEPPLSATVTIAVMLCVYSLSPRKSVARPCPRR